jgi:hypothetical protein
MGRVGIGMRLDCRIKEDEPWFHRGTISSTLCSKRMVLRYNENVVIMAKVLLGLLASR